MEPSAPARRRPRSLAMALVDAIGERIREGRLAPGDKLPTESAVMAEFGVSRTVVREAISKLQASGRVRTRHGVGSFVVAAGEGVAEGGFRIGPEHSATLRDVLAVLELRIGVETEAAGLAALRRSTRDLATLREPLNTMAAALASGRDAAAADYQFHLGIARATQNPHFTDLTVTLGAQAAEPLEYLHRVQVEHETIFDAIAAQDADAARAAMRTHLANSCDRRRSVAARLGDVQPLV